MGAFYLLCCIFITLVVTPSVITLKRTRDQPLSIDDIAQLFGADNLADVPDYEFINLDKLIKHQKDGRRDGLCFKAFDNTLCVKFIPNKQLAGRTHTVEYHHANGTVNKYTNVLRDYNLGIVNNEAKSHAAFYDGGRGLSGHIKVLNDLYIVNPLPPNLKSDRSNHVIYRRNRRDTTLQMLETGINDLVKLESGIDDAIKKRKANVTTQREKIMELMLAVDYTMVKFYHPDFLPTYLVAMANVIYGFFQDHSLAYPVTVALVKTVFFQDNKFKAATMYELYKKFSSWCVTNNPADDKNPGHWDNAILITRNGCADGCQIEGLAAINALCSPWASSVFRDIGLMSAMTAAHEIAHNFNARHDGDNNICKNARYLMASGSFHGGEKEEWSPCTSDVIEVAMKSPRSACFDDKPADKTRINYRLYGKEYNRTRQCKFMLGDSYVWCIHNTERCDSLFCSHKTSPNVCENRAYPPLDGTYCGPNLWCIHDKCVPDGTTPAPPVNGGWSAWGAYRSCNKECGVGVQWKERKCNTPEPHHGGLPCKGDTKDHFKTCNTQKCVGKEHPTPLEQCLKYKSHYTEHYLDRRTACKLNCGVIGGHEFIVEGWKTDGTKCDVASTSPDICVKRKCMKVGCDLVLGSGAVPDRCGVCDGNGSTCQFYAGKDMTPYNAYYGQYLLTTIPAGSINITVEELYPTWLGFLAFKVGNSTHYALHLPWIYNGITYDLNGTAIKFWSGHYTYADKIQAVGKIDKPISIYYFCYYGPRSTNKGITWRYYGPVTSTPVKPTYKWFGKEWSKCSLNCAGGKQKREVICLRTDDDSQVSKISCSSLTKLPSVQSCNTQNCDPNWHVTEWSSCSKHCGKGVMTRDILCSIKSITTRKTLSDLKLCIEAKPKVKISQDCNAKMCPAQWYILSKYGVCTASCGGGIKSRSVLCQHITADGVTRKTHPNECILKQKPVDKKKCNEQACPTGTP